MKVLYHITTYTGDTTVTDNGNDFVEIIPNSFFNTKKIRIKDLIEDAARYNREISVKKIETDSSQIDYYISEVLRYIGQPQRKSDRVQKRLQKQQKKKFAPTFRIRLT